MHGQSMHGQRGEQPRRHVRLRFAAAIAVAMATLVYASPVFAGDASTSATARRTAGPGAVRAAAPAETKARDASNAEPVDGVFQRLGERLLRLPLRPVRIGRTPRTPDDPEPGMGVVLRIPF